MTTDQRDTIIGVLEEELECARERLSDVDDSDENEVAIADGYMEELRSALRAIREVEIV